MGGVLPQPLQYVEIEAWSRITGNRINRWALGLLRMVDSIFLESASRRLNNEIERQKK